MAGERTALNVTSDINGTSDKKLLLRPTEKANYTVINDPAEKEENSEKKAMSTRLKQGGIGGGTGALIGGMVGSIVPGPGTVVGMLIGSAIGATVGVVKGTDRIETVVGKLRSTETNSKKD